MMSNQNQIHANLNRFFKEIYLKKQYLKKMQSKLRLITKLKEKNYKQLGCKFSNQPILSTNSILVMYVIDISFSKKNTLFTISDCLGNVKFFYSAGFFSQKGQGKISRSTVLRKFYRLLVSKFKFLKKVPVAIHFKNADSNMFWFLKKLKKKIFVILIKHFNFYPYNGCRKKKIQRKKFKSKFLQY